jgi:aryl-alcohol dehydrogenase-like predicted oxidoreductase
MQYREFGNTGFRASEIGLGTWQFGGDWGEISDEEVNAILKTALNNGVNFFDTADVYGAGRSETLIGNFLRNQSGSTFVATKLGRLEGYPDGYSLELFKRCAENSLRRLGRETIDLIQLHCVPVSWLKAGEIFDWLRVLRCEGKIRYFGASVETMEQALICLEQDDITSLQIIFNIFRQKPLKVLFKKAAEKKVALVIRLPLASGLLTGKFSKDTVFSPSDHRSYNRDGQAFSAGETFCGLDFEYGLDLVNQIRPLVPASMSMSQFALRFILDYPEVSVVIPGASKSKQVISNVNAASFEPLGKHVHFVLAQLYQNEIEKNIRVEV